MLKLCSAPERMIHHMRRDREHERYGEPSRLRAPIGAVSACPRAGSLMNSAAIAHSSPGTPATKNAARQPYACAT